MKTLKTCKQGNIDLILTKSISRLGKNTLDTLNEIFNLDVKVYFEKKNLNNYDKGMRTMMGIYAGFAHDSLDTKKMKNGNLSVVESKAVIVRKIFELYLKGWGVRIIKKYLEENGIKTVTGKDDWSTSTIDRMLSNEKYPGDLLM